MANQEELTRLQGPSPVSAEGKCASESKILTLFPFSSSSSSEVLHNVLLKRGCGDTQDDLKGAPLTLKLQT